MDKRPVSQVYSKYVIRRLDVELARLWDVAEISALIEFLSLKILAWLLRFLGSYFNVFDSDVVNDVQKGWKILESNTLPTSVTIPFISCL